MIKRKRKQLLNTTLLLLTLFSFYQGIASNINCKIPSDAILLTASTNILQSGKKYFTDKDLLIAGSTFTIEPNAELYIPEGVILQASGTMHMKGGLINICDNAGFFFKGAVNIGEIRSNNNAIVNVGDFSFFSVNGSISQLDPADGDSIKTAKAQFNLSDGANINVCATLSVASIHYPMVKYVGKGHESANVVNRAPASGAPGAKLSDSSSVNWFALAGLAHVSPGSANLCTDPLACESMWPPGLKAEIEGICSETGETKPAISLTKVGAFNTTTVNQGYASVGETINYTFKIKNIGNVALKNITLIDEMVGNNLIPEFISGDINNNNLLDVNEEWVYTLIYPVTQEDINRKAVYNIASASAKDFKFKTATATSYDPNPLPLDTPGHPGLLADCKKCTIVLLKEYNLVITNPHVRQLMLNLE
ncbi:hypothetical protein Q2490_13260 [Myroides odoratimimus]|uniref:DUF7507 domain-containing protein n=1 Tax=Myroides odoratimimus TaxID=76832 RepID=UPI0025770472|nr:hypothetical protein [Myroides odoratimimus]MDM1444625.1 hypothetical protein [Myroides odoratimimus]MDO5858258.1 hypothetical protein [Myroides odoratimimus]